MLAVSIDDISGRDRNSLIHGHIPASTDAKFARETVVTSPRGGVKYVVEASIGTFFLVFTVGADQ
jgi:hypothetical protein